MPGTGVGLGRGIGFPDEGGGAPGADAPHIVSVAEKGQTALLVQYEFVMSDGARIPFNMPKIESTRATGTIGLADDPTKKPEGDYYVTESFIGAPAKDPGKSYAGSMSIDLDFDGSDNGGIITYYTQDALYYKLKFAGGWQDGWVTLAPITPVTTRMATLQHEVDVLEQESHHSAPQPDKPATFDPSTVELTGGYADDWRDSISFSNHKVGSPITITKTSDDAHNAVILMSPEAALKVSGITLDGGLPAKWESHDITIGEKQYTAFISPYKLTKHPVDVGIIWSI